MVSLPMHYTYYLGFSFQIFTWEFFLTIVCWCMHKFFLFCSFVFRSFSLVYGVNLFVFWFPDSKSTERSQSRGYYRFTLDDQGTRISVAQYYREKYNIALKNVNLPALQAGSDTKPIYLPMEVVSLLWQFLSFYFVSALWLSFISVSEGFSLCYSFVRFLLDRDTIRD
jgi:hypothetical protein